MSQTNKLMTIVYVALATVTTFVAQNAYAGQPGDYPSSSGEPGSNPSNGSNGNPAPRTENASRQNKVIYLVPSKGNIKLDHTGFGPVTANSYVRNCHFCHIQ